MADQSVVINLDDYFQPREYQKPIIEAYENGCKKFLIVMPRRSGKDVVSFNIVIRAALEKHGRGTYFYIFPTFAQAKRAIFSAMLISGKKFLEFIPHELISSINASELKITLINGSIIQFVGSENCHDRLTGTNPLGVVFSEYAQQNPIVYAQVIRPILLANSGFVIWESTPRGRNHFYDLYQLAKKEDDYFAYFQTLDDTKHIDPALIRKDIENNVMSEDLALQEYWCSFSAGIEGAYFCKYIDQLRLKGQIGDVVYQPSLPVYSAWDIGVRDSNVITIFQVTPVGNIHIIDFIEGRDLGMEHYIKQLLEMPYQWGGHIGPHDLEVREYSDAVSRREKARNLGLEFLLAPKVGFMDGIEQIRTTLPKCFIAEKKCARWIKAIEQYHKEWDSDRQAYRDKPVHDWCSHFADSLRYLAVGLSLISPSESPKDMEARYQRAAYGTNSYGTSSYGQHNNFGNLRYR